jgi:cellulose synthase/poly-beta-1,6-N-acetylglucosamine synthase-like glycosyltransferase
MMEAAAILLVLPLLVLTGVLLIELSLGIRPSRGHLPPDREPTTRSVVVIPAHDEELSIGCTLAQIQASTDMAFRVLVIADNCTDTTAAIARASGAEVIERIDPDRRGKGYALAFARAHLAASPPETVLVIDADTVPDIYALERLADCATRTGRPVQAAYFIEAGSSATSLGRFSAMAFYVKNVVRQLGLARIGAPAILTGSGMAFPWSIFEEMPLETGHVTEDLMLGVWCSLAGRAPVFDPDAIVRGEASSDKGTSIQRRRWESGFLATALEYVPQLLVYGLRRRDGGLLWLALHLSTPPLLLLLAVDTLAVGALLPVALLSGQILPLILLVSLVTAVLAAVLVAASWHGRQLTFADMIAVPPYIVWKIALSIRTLVKRDTSWIRTSRE